MNILIDFCARNNAKLNVGGKILCDKKFEKCWQYLEGEVSVIEELWEKIKNDPMHEILVFEKEYIEARTIEDWGMDWKNRSS